MEFSNLPEEVAEKIYILLPLEDVLSCCLVNSYWRDAINKNLIWNKFCNPKVALEDKVSFVKPSFEPPPGDCELSSLCESRLSFMREVHMRNNFRNNRFHEFKISKIKTFQDKTEFLGDFLLLNDSYRNMFHIWNIESAPVLSESVPYILEEMCVETFQAVEDRLLIVQCNLIQVYLVLNNKFTLEMCRVFDREEEFSQNIPMSGISSWYSTNIGLFPCDFTSINLTVGNYFIGIVEPPDLKDSIVHIWDLRSGKKLKEEPIPETDSRIETICCGKNSVYLYIALYLNINNSWNNSRCKIFCYSLKTMKYTEFYVESSHSIPFMLFEEKVVVLPCDQWENSGSYLFLDPTTGKKIVEKEFDNPMNPKALDVNNSSLVFGSGNTVTIVSLVTQEVVTTLTLDFEVMEVYLLDNNILLVGGMDYHLVLQVWDINRHRQLYTLSEKSILFCGRTLPRLCLQSMYNVHVLHFW